MCQPQPQHWHVFQEAERGADPSSPAGDGASRTLLCISRLQHFWTEKASIPVSVEGVDKNGALAPGIQDLAPGTGKRGPGTPYELTGVASCSPVNRTLGQTGSPLT